MVALWGGVLCIGRGAAAQCVAAPPDVVSWWNGDSSGTTAFEIQGGNDGTLFGGVGIVSGLVGDAFRFDGVDDHVDLGSCCRPELDIVDGDHSISLWARWTATTGNARGLLNLGRFAGKLAVTTGFLDSGQDKVGYAFLTASGQSAWYYNAGSGLNDGNWHHIAVVKAGPLPTASAVTIYVDGSPVGFSFPGGVGYTTFNQIGTSNNGGFDGDIDEVALWNRALNAAEIQTIYQAGSAGMCTPPPPAPPTCLPPPADVVSWWDGDALAGSTAIDLEGSNDGTLVGGVGNPTGVVGSAFSFDGVDDYIDLGTDPSLDIADGNHSVTFWARWTAMTGNARSLLNLGTFGGKLSVTTGFLDGGQDKIGYAFQTAAGQSAWYYDAGSGLNDGNWHHIAIVKSGPLPTASAVAFYVDGCPVSFSFPGGVGISSFNRVGTGFSEDFEGEIDELALWSRALSHAEIQAICGAGSEGKCKPPVDPDPPLVSIDSPADGAVIGTSSVLLEVTVTDQSETTVVSTPAGINTTLPAGGGSASGTVALVEGPNNLSVTATDDAGHVGGTTIAVTSDTIAPALTVLSPLDGAVFGMSPAAFTISVVDATATTLTFGANSVALPAGGGVASGDVALLEGSNVVTVTATDEAGHVSSLDVTVILDLTAPIVTIDSPADGACFGPGASPVAVTATIDDLTATGVDSTPSGVAGSLPPGGGIVTGAVALAEGSNTVTVTATDATSLQGSAGILVILDTTPPDLTLISPSAGSMARGTLDFDATANDVLPGSGVARVDFYVDGNLEASLTAAPYELDYDTTLIADGTHTFSVEAIDGKGNSSSAAAQVLVDNTPPAIAIVTPLDGDIVSGTMSFDALADDGGSGVVEVEMLVEGGPPSVADGSVTLGSPQASVAVSSLDDTTLRTDGALMVSVRALDTVGNESISSVNVIVDNLGPEKTLVAPANRSRVSGVVDIIADSSAPDLDALEILVDGVSQGVSSAAPFQIGFDTTTRLDGTMTVTVTARDLAGNISSCSALVLVDNVSVRIRPRVISARWRHPGKWVRARLDGPNLDLMLPTGDHDIELLIPGGNPVAMHSSYEAGGHLFLRFSRRQVLSSVRAGLCAGVIQPNSRFRVKVVVDGQVIGADRMFVVGGSD